MDSEDPGWGAQSPVGRYDTAEEVAAAVTYLAFEEPAYLTGQ